MWIVFRGFLDHSLFKTYTLERSRERGKQVQRLVYDSYTA